MTKNRPTARVQEQPRDQHTCKYAQVREAGVFAGAGSCNATETELEVSFITVRVAMQLD